MCSPLHHHTHQLLRIKVTTQWNAAAHKCYKLSSKCRHKSSPTSRLCRLYHSCKLLLHWFFFRQILYNLCLFSQTGAWHWPLCKKCTDKFSFEYFKFVSSLFWHSIIIIINIVFYFVFQCYYSFLVSVVCSPQCDTVCMYFHVLFICFASVPWWIVWYLLKF